jgi:hypothetical protein
MYSDMVYNANRNTPLDSKYCYPCLFSGGIWTDESETALGEKTKNGHYCKYSNSILSALWKANPEDNGPKGTGVNITLDENISYE